VTVNVSLATVAGRLRPLGSAAVSSTFGLLRTVVVSAGALRRLLLLPLALALAFAERRALPTSTRHGFSSQSGRRGAA
jgi:hypothetical protein